MKKLYYSLVAIFMSGMLCSCTANADTIENADTARVYEHNYHTFSINTEIDTTIDGENVKISGNLLTFATDPLTMTCNDTIIAKADDTYKVIGQDDHAITVNGDFDIAIHGNFDLIGTSYDLHDANGNKVGYADFNATCTSGAVYDNSDNVIAKYSKYIGFNDYSVTIYDNDVCSDEAMLMIIASYVSDYHADND
jgi:hypothetical protein